jgi:PilZ domain
MSRRREKRSFLALPVRVSGTDAEGNSFRHVVCTLDLSAKGARISSLQALRMKIGQELMLEHQRDRVRFRVVWAGEPGTNREGQIGLQSLEPEKMLSAVQAQIERGSYIDDWHAPELRVEDSADERRSTPRFDCDRGVEYWTDQSASPFSGRLDNIGLGGCYVATKFPLPRHSRVQLILHLYGMKIPAQGEVRSSDAQGMGIMFTLLDKEFELRVKKAVQRLSQSSQSAENRASQPRSSDAHILDEIRSWFDRNLTMTWEEFFDIQVRSKGNLVSASFEKDE